jgi:pseudouridine synthase
MHKTRLHQFLSSTGAFISKRALIDAVYNNEVSIDGRVVANPNFYFKPDKSRVLWKGRPLQEVGEKIYILINKPEGFLSSRLTPNDVKWRKRSVFDLLSREKRLQGELGQSLVCAGRLDEDTSGLLIITNDGQMVSDITRPESRIRKTYEVLLAFPPSADDIEQLKRGIKIRVDVDGRFVDYTTKPADVMFSDDKRMLRVMISEGRKREVRLMFEKLGNKVRKLRRVAIGSLSLDDFMIKSGEYFFVEKGMIESGLR